MKNEVHDIIYKKFLKTEKNKAQLTYRAKSMDVS